MQTLIQVSVTEAIMMRSLLAVCVLAMVAPAAAFAPGSVPTLRSARAPAISMQKKVDILDKGDIPPVPFFALNQGGALLLGLGPLLGRHMRAHNLQAQGYRTMPHVASSCEDFKPFRSPPDQLNSSSS